MAMTPAAFESPPKRVCKNRPNAAICRTVIRTAGLEWAARRERCQGAIHSPFLEHQPASRNDPPGPSNPVVRAYRLRPWTASGALHSPSAPEAVAPSAPEAIALPKVAIGPSCTLPTSSHPAGGRGRSACGGADVGVSSAFASAQTSTKGSDDLLRVTRRGASGRVRPVPALHCGCRLFPQQGQTPLPHKSGAPPHCTGTSRAGADQTRVAQPLEGGCQCLAAASKAGHRVDRPSRRQTRSPRPCQRFRTRPKAGGSGTAVPDKTIDPRWGCGARPISAAPDRTRPGGRLRRDPCPRGLAVATLLTANSSPSL